MSGARLLSGVIGAGFAILASVAAQATELPAGPNRDVVSHQCGACHDLDNLVNAAGASRDAWDGAIDEMIGYGLKVTPDERAKILDYLATALGPSAKKSTAR